MIVLINSNRMAPVIGPIGLDYVAGAARRAGEHVGVIDLCLEDDPRKALREYFGEHDARLVGVTLRNVDDCFWPKTEWFMPGVKGLVGQIRELTEAPIVIGGVGFSIFGESIVDYSGADFGVRGDGEQAIVSLAKQLRGKRCFEQVDGLIWRTGGQMRSNKPAWPDKLELVGSRDAIDNRAYFEKGGQGGIETKRGCNRSCIYCADPLAKGGRNRLRNPSEVADEVEVLLRQGVDVLHLCDAEFNVPGTHAAAVCAEFNRRGLGERVRWYAYLAVTPFDAELAEVMSRAGCVGINFTGDAGCAAMLERYGHLHTTEQVASAIGLCRSNRMKVMIDLMLGGPEETPETVAETIEFIKEANPDCAGAALGIRLYPGTEMTRIALAEGPVDSNPNIHRAYTGPIDLLRPTFYVSSLLGERPGELVCDLIGGDQRFFEPTAEMVDENTSDGLSRDHNYNDNTELVVAIANGARGAYWDILRQLRD